MLVARHSFELDGGRLVSWLLLLSWPGYLPPFVVFTGPLLLLSLGLFALFVAGEPFLLLIVRYCWRRPDLLQVDPGALDCDFAGALDGHLAYVALGRRLLLLLLRRG